MRGKLLFCIYRGIHYHFFLADSNSLYCMIACSLDLMIRYLICADIEVATIF